MKLSGRRKDIYDILCEKKRVSVAHLAKGLFVSEMTVRRDLAEMEKQGFLKRYRGGAILHDEMNLLPLSQRMFLEEEEKRELAQKAQKYLCDGISVYIDSSSTCQFIIPHIKKFSHVKIITNSVKAVLIASKLHLPCFLIGGEYYEQDMCLVGSVSEEIAARINVDVAFFTAQGFSEEGVISDSDIEQTSVRRIVMRNAKKRIFLFEKTKLGKKYLHTLCSAADADEVILCDGGGQ
ncbi:MAG: DeoR/GlpR transcriptional regulator [Clostridia bacterium]|nr:DeoR/GlpR transcriptional regulator [Clostridia bacterium]